VSYDGEAYDGSVQQQIAREFSIYADSGPYSFPRTPVSYEVELTMVVPAWVQDYRTEKLAGMSDREKADAGSMGYGYRIEQLFRAKGTLKLDGMTRDFKAVGSRIHRQSVRPWRLFADIAGNPVSFLMGVPSAISPILYVQARRRKIATISGTCIRMEKCIPPVRGTSPSCEK